MTRTWQGRPMNLPAVNLDGRTLSDALRLYREGYVSDQEWAAYAHAWQTSAPRFGIRACDCASCSAAFPRSEGYRAP